ncbi:dnaJ homolog subfamily C member 17-like [Palaemon carinicauda]|uniref:dnaJ homolog subfamily C member 17-like n=1 Tax=Palaemon carinicauda TaxID=392227 RepID=UPI0035B612F3
MGLEKFQYPPPVLLLSVWSQSYLMYGLQFWMDQAKTSILIMKFLMEASLSVGVAIQRGLGIFHFLVKCILFRRELKRLEDEGQRIIEEELDKLNREVERDLKGTSGVNENKCTTKETDVGHKVKVKWAISRETPGYTEEDIRQLFYKWGDINAMVMKQKSKKGTALIEYKTKTGAIVTDGFQLDFWVTVFGPRMNKSNFKDMAVQFEKGQIGKPLEVVHVKAEAPKVPEHKEIPQEEKDQSGNYDYESIADMNIRRQDERRRLIEEILKEEAMK